MQSKLPKYEKEVLAYDTYQKFYETDVTNKSKLISIINDALDLQAFFTKTGFDFLMEFYGMNNLANIIYEEICAKENTAVFVDNDNPTKEKSIQNIKNWLKDLNNEVSENEDFYKP